MKELSSEIKERIKELVSIELANYFEDTDEPEISAEDELVINKPVAIGLRKNYWGEILLGNVIGGLGLVGILYCTYQMFEASGSLNMDFSVVNLYIFLIVVCTFVAWLGAVEVITKRFTPSKILKIALAVCITCTIISISAFKYVHKQSDKIWLTSTIESYRDGASSDDGYLNNLNTNLNDLVSWDGIVTQKVISTSVVKNSKGNAYDVSVTMKRPSHIPFVSYTYTVKDTLPIDKEQVALYLKRMHTINTGHISADGLGIEDDEGNFIFFDGGGSYKAIQATSSEGGLLPYQSTTPSN